MSSMFKIKKVYLRPRGEIILGLFCIVLGLLVFFTILPRGWGPGGFVMYLFTSLMSIGGGMLLLWDGYLRYRRKGDSAGSEKSTKPS